MAGIPTSGADVRTQTGKMPAGVPYIIGNEAAERFSFYGMKAILTTFLAAQFFNGNETMANEQTHAFIAMTYLLPLIGGMLADWFLGKYNTIFWLSLVYVAGHACLSVFENSLGGFLAGLMLISIGSGGIKPCVSANVGDQFDQTNSHLMTNVFNAFYFSINFGSFFSTLLIPWTLKWYGPSVAFGIPGILMAIAAFVFWLGNDKYVRVPPKGDSNKVVIFICTVAALAISYFVCDVNKGFGIALLTGQGPLLVLTLLLVIAFALIFKKQWFARPGNFIGINLYALANGGFAAAEKEYGEKTISGIKSVWNVLAVFAFIPIFWALYDQNGSEWVQQAKYMNRNFMGILWQPEQIQAINPVLIMVFIPIFLFGLFPLVAKMGIKVTPLRKIGVGFFLTALSFVFIALPQAQIDGFLHTLPAGISNDERTKLIEAYASSGNAPSILWQLLAYTIITAAEVLISTTGLEYAYTQAPKTMKGTIMACWLLTVTIGNVVVSQVHTLMKDGGILSGLEGSHGTPGAAFYWLFLGVCLATGILFVLISPRIKEHNYVGNIEE
jgi:POT family proton-dependent oligopeptide transporter